MLADMIISFLRNEAAAMMLQAFGPSSPLSNVSDVAALPQPLLAGNYEGRTSCLRGKLLQDVVISSQVSFSQVHLNNASAAFPLSCLPLFMNYNYGSKQVHTPRAFSPHIHLHTAFHTMFHALSGVDVSGNTAAAFAIVVDSAGMGVEERRQQGAPQVGLHLTASRQQADAQCATASQLHDSVEALTKDQLVECLPWLN